MMGLGHSLGEYFSWKGSLPHSLASMWRATPSDPEFSERPKGGKPFDSFPLGPELVEE